jgi:hypothetical protein
MEAGYLDGARAEIESMGKTSRSASQICGVAFSN